MTEVFIKIYRYFQSQRMVFWTLMVALFAFFGYFAMQIHLEEDLAKMLPSSKNEDGSTKLAFADLKIKDKTFLLFKGEEGVSTDSIIQVCDSFVTVIEDFNNSLSDDERLLNNVFASISKEDLLDEVADYMPEHLTEHLPCYLDSSIYARLEQNLCEDSLRVQMLRNRDDLINPVYQTYGLSELVQMDPFGLRSAIIQQYAGMMSGMGGTYSIIDDHFFTKDSTVCIVFLSPEFTSFNTGKGAKLFTKLNEEIERFSQMTTAVKVMYHGSPARGAYNSWQTKRDLMTTIVGSLLVVLIFIFFCFRNWNTIPLLLLPVGFGTLFGLAMMYFIKGQFSLLALGIGAIVLGVALSYVLHVITHYKYVSDPEQVLRDQVKPVFLGCLTTVGSFMGLIFVKTELLQDFGLFATFAIVGTTLFSLAFLPQFFNAEKNKINRRAFAAIDKFNAYPFDRKKPLLWTIGILSGIGVMFYFYGGTDFDADMRNLGYRSENVNESEDLYQEKTRSGFKQQYFASSGNSIEEALENFAALDTKLDSLQQAGLVKSYTHTNQIFIPASLQQRRIEAWQNFWSEERAARADSLVRLTAAEADLNPEVFAPFFEAVSRDDFEADEPLYDAGLIPEGFLSTLMEQNATNCLVFSSVTCEMDLVRSDSTDYHRICDAIAKEPNLMVLDTYYYTTDGLKELNEDFNVLQWVSMLFVLLVLLVSFRFNWRHTLLGFLPIIVSWLIVLGAMVIFDRQFNLINIIISTFIFGIGVDYSIFVMSGLIGNGTEGSKQDRNLLHYHKTAILFSAVTLIVTVASMLFAKHPAIQSVGFATLVGMVSAVVISYVAQPACFRFLNKKNKN